MQKSENALNSLMHRIENMQRQPRMERMQRKRRMQKNSK